MGWYVERQLGIPADSFKAHARDSVLAAQLGARGATLEGYLLPGRYRVRQGATASEVVTGFGEKGVPAERVARRAARALQRHLAADVPVGEHLADQILVPLALAGGGSFRTLPLSSHARTNAALIERFLPVRIDETAADAGACIVRITPCDAG